MSKILSFMAGCGAGILAGLILAPSSGKELRSNVSTKVRDGVDTMAGKVEDGRRFVQDQVERNIERGRTAANSGIQRMNDTVQQGKDKLDRITETIEAGKKRVNDAIAAGKAEYQAQKDRDAAAI